MAESRFQKRLRFWPMVAVMYVLLCGGPYGIEEVVPQSGPTLAVFGMIFMALFWGLPNILQTAEIASALPLQGGAYRWYKESWGGFWGFQFGWLEWLSWMFEAALYPTLVAIYCVHFFFPEAGIYTTWCITLSVIWISIVLNIRGIQTVGKWSAILAWFQVLPVLWFIIIGVNHIDLSFLSNLNIPANTTTLEALTMALIFGLWNFSGYAGLATAAEEIEDTPTTYPKALLITLIISLVMYVVPLIIGISVDQNWSNWDEAQFNSAALVLGGGAFAWWFMLAAQSSNFGLINSELIVLSRLIQAMSMDGFLPQALNKLHHKYETPVHSLIMQGILLSIMTFGMGFVDLLVVGTWLSIPTYLIGFAVFISLRIQKPDMDRPFKIKGGWLVIIPIVAIPCFIALFIFINTPKDYLLETIPLLLSGFAVYFIQKIFSK
jgi:amino acid transporter